eukprot:TRINITY_DN67031_c6_g6_i1.p1 TRINITY_DN67031_c6_g6~~TRINITY_DN67031_c6_g6_i1.p1  ORF type:complete len:473 (+),score=63.39 TRINITY_DN67031_c6_g6_i1:33-1451(+)
MEGFALVEGGDIAALTDVLDKPVSEGGGVSIDFQNEQGVSLLHHAALRGRENIVLFLLLRGANPNIQDSTQQTPLHYACVNGEVGSAAVLMSLDGDIHAKDANGQVPAHLAATHGFVNLVKFLERKGGDDTANWTDAAGKSPQAILEELTTPPPDNVASPKTKRSRRRKKEKTKAQAQIVVDTAADEQQYPSKTTRLAAQQVLLASWNIRNLSKKRTDEELKKIATIIEEFDFIAMLEVRDEEVLKKLLVILGDNKWRYCCSTPVGTDHHKEYYAFMYRTDVVSLVSEDNPPVVLKDTSDVFVREPYVGNFKAGNFDFVMAVIHVVWGKKIGERREEVGYLNKFMKTVADHAQGENDIILCGDFNMPPADKAWRMDDWKPLILDPLRTMVGDTSLYDNFWVHGSETLEQEFSGQCGVLKFDHIFYAQTPEGRKQAKDECSDHRPIWALFNAGEEATLDGVTAKFEGLQMSAD